MTREKRCKRKDSCLYDIEGVVGSGTEKRKPRYDRTTRGAKGPSVQKVYIMVFTHDHHVKQVIKSKKQVQENCEPGRPISSYTISF